MRPGQRSEDSGKSTVLRKRVTLINVRARAYACTHIHLYTITKITTKQAGVCLHSSTLCFITGPFPPPNTWRGAGDKECTHSALYTTSHLSRGNWKEEEKGGECREVRRTADEGTRTGRRRGGQWWRRMNVCRSRDKPGPPRPKAKVWD